MPAAKDLRELRFGEAAQAWLLTRLQYISPSTTQNYREYIAALIPFFGASLIDSILAENVRSYQVWRSEQAGASRINHETNTLCQVLRWADLAVPRFECVPLAKWIPRRTLSRVEEARFFRIAASNPDWAVAYYATVISANTTASGCEIRGLKIRNLDLLRKVIFIHPDTVKNRFRARVIPLNEKAALAATQALRRYQLICRRQRIHPLPDHYLFPFRVKTGLHSPDKQASRTFIRGAFREIRAAAGLPWLRPHDWRYQAITKLLECPNVSEQTVKALAGHVSDKMMNHYSHIRIHAKRAAVNGLKN